MALNAVSVEKYDFQSQDELFLDANIWLYVYAPQNPKSYWVKVYSKAFERILIAKSCIYIDILVVSEFINTYARLKWEHARREHARLKWKHNAPHIKTFKTFRKSDDFKTIAREIADNTKRVLGHCSKIESDFKTLRIDNLMNDYAAGYSDFNDQVITELCQRKGLKLITNDSDFKGQDITILTANKKLLS